MSDVLDIWSQKAYSKSAHSISAILSFISAIRLRFSRFMAQFLIIISGTLITT